MDTTKETPTVFKEEHEPLTPTSHDKLSHQSPISVGSNEIADNHDSTECEHKLSDFATNNCNLITFMVVMSSCVIGQNWLAGS